MKRTLAILLTVAALSGCATGAETPEEAAERRARISAALMMFGNSMQQSSQQMQMNQPVRCTTTAPLFRYGSYQTTCY